MPNTKSPQMLCAMMMLSAMMLSACAAVQLPDYEIQPLDKYRHSKIIEGLAVAIQPFTEKQEVEKYFGTNLLSDGIFPVLIIAENRGSTSSYILFKGRFLLVPGLIGPGKTSVRESLGADRAAEAVQAGVLAGLAAGMAVPAVTPFVVPFMFAGQKMTADASEIKYNLAIKELHTKTISPGKHVAGFIYFKMPETPILADRWVIHLEVLDLQSKNTVRFDIPFDFKWPGG